MAHAAGCHVYFVSSLIDLLQEFCRHVVVVTFMCVYFMVYVVVTRIRVYGVCGGNANTCLWCVVVTRIRV
jgi:hypothetical protein